MLAEHYLSLYSIFVSFFHVVCIKFLKSKKDFNTFNLIFNIFISHNIFITNL